MNFQDEIKVLGVFDRLIKTGAFMSAEVPR